MDHYDIVIIGGGFGGAFAAHHLGRLVKDEDRRVLLVSPENFLLFSPLLPEAASGTLEPRHAVIPLRSMIGRVELVVGSVESIDVDSKRLAVASAAGTRREISFQILIASPGSIPRTLPIPGLAEHAVGFKTLADAIWLRNRVIAQLEAAEACDDRLRRRELLTFTFVGGGYAGVEALAELDSMARDSVAQYRHVDASDLRWVLVEATASLMPGLDARLADYTRRRLVARGVEVHVSTRLTSCVDHLVELDDPSVMPYRSETIVWTAGQRASPFVSQLGVPLDKHARAVVDDHLRALGRSDIYVVGDAAAVPDPDGGTSPATAQHALREAKVAAINAAADLGIGHAVAFRYRNRGLAVTLGKWDGTAEVRGHVFSGPLAWWMGRSYHLMMTPGLTRKARILADWNLGLLFPRDLAQLGTLGQPSALPPPE